MSNNSKSQAIIITISFAILLIAGVSLYNKFFKQINLDNISVPAAEIERISPAIQLPEFSFLDENHKSINIRKFKGKILLINFWATWCKPCIKELPQLDNLIEILGPENIDIITISIDNNKTINDLKNFFNNLNIKNLNIYQDKDARGYELLNAIGIPTTILVDRNLNAHLKVSGYLNWQDTQIMNLINQLP